MGKVLESEGVVEEEREGRRSRRKEGGWERGR